MGLPVINYERINRLKEAEIPIPSRWDMTWATKVCMAIIAIGMLILLNRWTNKKDKIQKAVARSYIF